MSAKKETGSSKDNTFKVTYKESGKSFIMKPADGICAGCMGEFCSIRCSELSQCGNFVFLKELDNA